MKNEIAFLITFLILLSSCNFKKEKIEFKNEGKLSVKIQTVISNIIEYGEITGPFVGISGSKPKQWDNFIELKKNATESELLTLMEHPNPIVKCYSFDILVKKKNENCFKILKTNFKDSTTVYTQFGCIGNQTRVNDYLISSMFFPLPLKEKDNNLHKKELDSLILFSKNLTLDYKSQLLEKIEPKKEFYAKIKELALSENYSAVVALSKFKKIEDIQIINRLLRNKETEIQYYGLMSVKNFTNKAFFENVTKIHQQEIEKKTGFDYSVVRLLYQAIVSYKNLESRNLLEETIKNTDGYQKDFHYENIWRALKGNPNEIYNGIIEKLNYSEYDLKELEYEWEINTAGNTV